MNAVRALFFIIVAAVCGAGYWYFTQQDAPAGNAGWQQRAGFNDTPIVVVEPVRHETMIDIIEALGTTQANESVTLTAKVTDTVSKVNFDDGDYVEAGRILIEQTNNEESALLAEAQANLDDAISRLRRLEDLESKNLVSHSEVDQARAQADAATGRFNAITARLNDRLVRAPYAGLLGFREVSPGTLLTTSTAITTLDDISIIKLDFSVPEIYLDIIKPDLPIRAKSAAWSDREFAGVISTVNSRVNPVTRAVTVRAMIENDARMLRPGMLMTVKIESNERQVLVVRESSLVQVGSDIYVFMAGPDNKAFRKQVRAGSRKNGMVEITDGLKEGDQIITEGIIKLREGTEFSIAESTLNRPANMTDTKQMGSSGS
jgi:membrane fusion protein (multidrug efflux system)